MCVCVYVCVCVFKRQRERQTHEWTQIFQKTGSHILSCGTFTGVVPAKQWQLWEVQKDRVILQSWWNRGPWDVSLGCIHLVNAVHLLRCSSGFLDATSTEVFGDRKADEDEGWLQQPLTAALGENLLHSFINQHFRHFIWLLLSHFSRVQLCWTP